MTKLGEIRQDMDARYPSAKGATYIWHACLGCGKERWVRLSKGKPQSLRCPSCGGKIGAKKRDFTREKHPGWKGGILRNSQGYVGIMLAPDDPFYPMVDAKSYVKEHRLLVAKRMGRCLARTEVVHHINGIHSDNRDENLELISRTNHSLRTRFCDKCENKKELRLLKWQIKNLEEQVGNLTTRLMGVE